jgi:hypothetical protein
VRKSNKKRLIDFTTIGAKAGPSQYYDIVESKINHNITRATKDTPKYKAQSSRNFLTQSTNFTSPGKISEDSRQVRHHMIGPIRRPVSRSIPPIILGHPLDPEPKENSKNFIVGVRGLKNHKKKIFFVGAGPDDRSHRKPQPAASKKRHSLQEGAIAAYN